MPLASIFCAPIFWSACPWHTNRSPEGIKHQVRLPKGKPDGSRSQPKRRWRRHESGRSHEAAKAGGMRSGIDATGVCQGPKFGSKRQAKFGGPKGPIKIAELSPQLSVGPLDALSEGAFLGDPSGSSWENPSNFRDHLPSLLGALRVLDGASTVHPIGPSFWAFFLAP